jgi:hypothetical protein
VSVCRYEVVVEVWDYGEEVHKHCWGAGGMNAHTTYLAWPKQIMDVRALLANQGQVVPLWSRPQMIAMP